MDSIILKKTEVINTKANGVTQITAGMITIIKSKLNKEDKMTAEEVVKKVVDIIEENPESNIIQRDDIINDTIGCQFIETKSITITFKKKISQHIHAFIKDDYLIQIIVTEISGKTDKSSKMILDSFYFMPENNYNP